MKMTAIVYKAMFSCVVLSLFVNVQKL